MPGVIAIDDPVFPDLACVGCAPTGETAITGGGRPYVDGRLRAEAEALWTAMAVSTTRTHDPERHP